VIRGGAAAWFFRERWSKDELLKHHGRMPFPEIGKIPYASVYSNDGHATLSIQEFVGSFMDGDNRTGGLADGTNAKVRDHIPLDMLASHNALPLSSYGPLTRPTAPTPRPPKPCSRAAWRARSLRATSSRRRPRRWCGS